MQEVIRPDGSVIPYEITGSGDPVLLLAPGGISSAAQQWSQYFIDPRTLADEFSVITMDQRHAGAGRTALAPFSHAEVFDDQNTVLEALGIKTAAVIGADFYCASAIKFACDAPARTRAVVLIEPMAVDQSNSINSYYAMFNDTIRIARAEGLQGVVSAAQTNGVFNDNPEGGPWAQRLHDQAGFSAAIHSIGREGYISLIVDFRDGAFPSDKRFFSVNDLSVTRSSVPMFIAAGNDAQHPSGLAAELCKNTKNSSFDGIGREKPTELLSQIREFIRGHFSG
ncbi:MAG: alpha/beta hydrolase [Pseudomonadales bacterium]|nr:alpha/beta hydrolase [Pseudomonadales bacterium]